MNGALDRMDKEEQSYEPVLYPSFPVESEGLQIMLS